MPFYAKDRFDDFLQALLEGNHRVCHRLVDDLLEEQISILDLYQQFFQKALYIVGTYWEDNRISVATEHIATSIIEDLMVKVYPILFSRPRIHRSAIVACGINEYHQVGAKMVADTLEYHGWDTLFVGANSELSGLIQEIAQRHPHALIVSLSLEGNLPRLEIVVKNLRERFPHLPIIIGGQAFRHGGQERFSGIPNVQFLGSLQELEEWAKSFSKQTV